MNPTVARTVPAFVDLRGLVQTPPVASELEQALAAAAGARLVNAPAPPSPAEPVIVNKSPEHYQALRADRRAARDAARQDPFRYAGFYNLFGGVDEAMRTLEDVPLAGVVRALAESGGMHPKKAKMLEQGAAGLTVIGVGVPTLMAAANALNGDDRQVVVVQGAGR
ncbi:MAG: hypothetical protein VKK97_10975 [Synechococcaceae cyanobacterium]|nr:hypothetical protein [Synechococcaceae cyanobacterium]